MMDAYQKKALELLKVDPNCLGRVTSEKTGWDTCSLALDENDSIVIKGDDDIFSKDYKLLLRVGRPIKPLLLIGGDWVELEEVELSAKPGPKRGYPPDSVKKVYASQIIINLDNRPTKLKLIVPGEVVDDIIIDIKYDLMSEEDYWKMMNSPEMLRKNMAVTYRIGENLVNIYRKHAKENIIAAVRIDLYLKNGDGRQPMGKYKASNEMFFKSIDGLAYGSYVFELFQFDKDGNKIASSGLILFTIENQKDQMMVGTVDTLAEALEEDTVVQETSLLVDYFQAGFNGLLTKKRVIR